MLSMKKRLLSLLLCLLMLFSLAGCTQELIDTALDVLLEEGSAAPEETSRLTVPSTAPELSVVQTPEPAIETESPDTQTEEPAVQTETPDTLSVSEEGQYSDKEHVALYLHTYGHLPSNYLTKSEAEKLGWVSSKGNLWDVAPGMSIGGDRFGNREGLLPDASGRRWYECDIGYEGGFRGGMRIVFSSDGLIYYTEDHYSSFEQLY